MPKKPPTDILIASVFISLVAELITLTVIVLATQYFSGAGIALIAWIGAVFINNIYFAVKLVKQKPERYMLYIILLLLPVVFILAAVIYMWNTLRGITC